MEKSKIIKSKIRMPDNYFAMWLIANKIKILIFNVLTISCIMLKNGQTYFTNLVVFTP